MKCYLVLVVVLLVSLCCHAADDSWYGAVGTGTMVVRGLDSPSRLERDIFNTGGVSGSSITHGKSSFESVAVGKCPTPHFCIEGAYVWGAEFTKTVTIVATNAGVVNVGGVLVDTSQFPVFTLRQEAHVSAAQLSVLGKAPVNEKYDVFGRVGIYEYQVKMISKIPLYQNIYLSEERTECGTVPVMSLGFDVRSSDQTTGRFEGQKIGKVSIFSFWLLHKF